MWSETEIVIIGTEVLFYKLLANSTNTFQVPPALAAGLQHWIRPDKPPATHILHSHRFGAAAKPKRIIIL